ncbi:hypothetical protein HDU79_011726 [Rhizoclosmatium sp. JEL0117]|nr:hypothetical protein HDU79_011726 [Rhizoclosmatium sp. JEL0117]
MALTSSSSPRPSADRKVLIDDTNIMTALAENWDAEHTVSHGFDRGGVLNKYPGAYLLVVDNIEPVNLWERFAFVFLRDRRDVQVFNVAFLATVTLWPSFLYMYFVGISWFHAVAHIVATIIQIGPFHLAMHVSAHRKAFKSEFLNDFWLPVIVGPFFGQTFFTYFFHHIKMHHVADNGLDDTSCTLLYQRDKFTHFLHYFGRFYFVVWYELGSYFVQHNQPKRAMLAVACEFGSMILYATLSYFNFYAMLFCVWIPFNLSRLFMMSGNWTQHSFLNRETPLSGGLSNSITIINTRFNALCFNDGYHASHHLNAQRHWTEHPRHFLQNREIYKDAIVLQNTDYEEMFFCLMTGWYSRIASKLVDHAGIGQKLRSIDERVAWLKERTRQFSVEEILAAQVALKKNRVATEEKDE